MKQKILLFTLVHPDFLPPVYASAQTLRDLGYDIHILTFDSYVPAESDLGPNIVVESVGKHHDIPFLQRWRLRRKYAIRASELVTSDTHAIISFCPFSFLTALKFKSAASVIYFALEIADFEWKYVMHSPLNNFNNLIALKSLTKADLVATPSVQRSAWLAGRVHMDVLPDTIFNTSYFSEKDFAKPTQSVFRKLVPAHFLAKKILLYTGAVNERLCVSELVQAFVNVGDQGCAMIVTGMKDNPYCNEIRKIVAASSVSENVQLLPYVSREEMLALQANSHIGACLVREYHDNIASKMIAPNKVGEYLNKGLFILGVKCVYMNMFENVGVAALADSPSVADISITLKDALKRIAANDTNEMIISFVKDYYCMQKQAEPIISFLAKHQ